MKIYQTYFALCMIPSYLAASFTHLQVAPEVSGKHAQPQVRKSCFGSCYTADKARSNVYKSSSVVPVTKIHVERHQEMSEIIDIDGLNLHEPINQKMKMDDATLTTYRSYESLQPMSDQLSVISEAGVQTKPATGRSAWQRIKQTFSFKKDINQPNRSGIFPIQQAVMEQNVKEIIKLVQAGADTNVVSRNGDTLVHLAVKSLTPWQDCQQVIAIVEYLLEHGVSKKLNVQNKHGKTPLHLAVMTLDAELVDVLIAQKIQLNLQDSAGNTPLMLVINRGMPAKQFHQEEIREKQLAVIKSLLSAGADISIKNHNNRLPIEDANYQVKEHGMLPQVVDELNRVYARQYKNI